MLGAMAVVRYAYNGSPFTVSYHIVWCRYAALTKEKFIY